MARMIRASLLARANAATIRDLLVSIRACHEPDLPPSRPFQRMIDIAPSAIGKCPVDPFSRSSRSAVFRHWSIGAGQARCPGRDVSAARKALHRRSKRFDSHGGNKAYTGNGAHRSSHRRLNNGFCIIRVAFPSLDKRLDKYWRVQADLMTERLQLTHAQWWDVAQAAIATMQCRCVDISATKRVRGRRLRTMAHPSAFAASI